MHGTGWSKGPVLRACAVLARTSARHRADRAAAPGPGADQLAGWPPSMRVFARRERPHPGRPAHFVRGPRRLALQPTYRGVDEGTGEARELVGVDITVVKTLVTTFGIFAPLAISLLGITFRAETGQ